MTEKSKPHVSLVAPIMPVTDVSASMLFYTQKLLFVTSFEWSDSDGAPVRYAILQKDDTELHLTQVEKPVRTSAYFFVHGVTEYFEAVKGAGADILGGLTDQPWKMREFDIADPDGNILLFGEHLDRISEE